jgi:hypothetical protein
MRDTAPGSTVEHAMTAATIALAGRLTAQQDRFAEAEAAAGAALSSPIRFPIFDLYARLALAVIAVEEEDAAAAGELYRALETQAGTLLILACMAADRLLGLLALAMGEPGTASAHFDAALGFCRRAGYRPEYARTAFDYARALMAHGGASDGQRSAALWDEGLTIARACRMPVPEEPEPSPVRQSPVADGASDKAFPVST